MRLMLAALMLLAGLATTRLQGEIAARQVLFASLGLSLCSGEHLPGDAAPDDARHVHCALCTIPLAADVPGCTAVPATRAGIATAYVPALPFSPAEFALAAYQPRGPPLLG